MGNELSSEDYRFQDSGWLTYGKVSDVSEIAKMRDGLSKREGEVLSWLQQGMSNKEIALALDVSPRTVQKHLQRIYLHLDVGTRAEAIVRMRRGLRDTPFIMIAG